MALKTVPIPGTRAATRYAGQPLTPHTVVQRRRATPGDYLTTCRHVFRKPSTRVKMGAEITCQTCGEPAYVLVPFGEPLPNRDQTLPKSYQLTLDQC